MVWCVKVITTIHRRCIEIGSEWIIFVLLPASLYDIWQYKVPNALLGAAFLISLIRHVDAQGFTSLYPWLAGTFVPIFLTFIFFKLRMLGASDVKLYAFVGSVLGVSAVLQVLVYSLFVGAVLAAAKIICRRNLWSRFFYLRCYICTCVQERQLKPYYGRGRYEKDGIVPFTIAISIAAILSMP